MHKNRKQILEAGARGEEVTLTGVIVPGELDPLFKVVSVLLASDQELDFLVENNARGNELFGHLREPVRAMGFIRIDEKGRRTIQIVGYEVLEHTEKGGMKAATAKIRDRRTIF